MYWDTLKAKQKEKKIKKRFSFHKCKEDMSLRKIARKRNTLHRKSCAANTIQKVW